MARWLVNRRDRQFGAEGLAELRTLAREGKLGPGDLVQPPGAADWLYASEIAELAADLAAGAPKLAAAEELDAPVKAGPGMAVWLLASLVLGVVAVGAGAMAWKYAGQMPDPTKQLLDQVSFSQMVVTAEGASLVSAPEAGASSVAPLADGAVIDLLAKRKSFYKARDPSSGAEGWVRVDHVLPAYLLGGGEVLKEHDPLYNPDRYVFVQNASWIQLPEQAEENLTIFQVRLQNSSMYDMTGFVLVARIKDSHGQDLEQVEFAVDGVLPAGGATMIGTLVDPETDAKRFVTEAEVARVAQDRPEVQLDYTEGVEVKMATQDFTAAAIDIVELRAVPKGS